MNGKTQNVSLNTAKPDLSFSFRKKSISVKVSTSIQQDLNTTFIESSDESFTSEQFDFSLSKIHFPKPKKKNSKKWKKKLKPRRRIKMTFLSQASNSEFDDSDFKGKNSTLRESNLERFDDVNMILEEKVREEVSKDFEGNDEESVEYRIRNFEVNEVIHIVNFNCFCKIF